MFKQILVGIDGSEHSYRALDYARNLAEHYGAAVCLLSAYRRRKAAVQAQGGRTADPG